MDPKALATIKCPYCDKIFRIDIKDSVERSTIGVISGRFLDLCSKCIDLECPFCGEEFEWQA